MKCCDKCGAPIDDGGGQDGREGGGLAELLGAGGGDEGHEAGGGEDAEMQVLQQILDKIGGHSLERFKKPDDGLSIEMIAAGKPKKKDEEFA